jgi:hypothetical protein
MKTQWMIYCELELIPDSEPEPQPTFASRCAQLKHQLGNLWTVLIEAMNHKPEPQIWQECDRTGNTWWCAYDPITQQSLYAESEGEVMQWLGQRPYF